MLITYVSCAAFHAAREGYVAVKVHPHFRVQGLAFRVSGLGFRVKGLGFRILV